jgi:benzoyl-CoA reductase/2-hydroxyglutaryl-CoA dehydratase subunit BcrC/BadD/HgdB
MAEFENLFAVADAPYQRCDQRRFVAVFPMWFPYEIFLAAGMRVAEWWGYDVPPTLADAHFPTYICTLVKSNFELLLNGQSEIDGAAFPVATCDSIQNSAGLFQHLFPGKFVAYFRMVQNPDSASAAEYLRSELRRLIAETEAIAGRKISDNDLRNAIETVNAFRQTARDLLVRLQSGRPSLPGAQIYKALRGALADIGPYATRLLRDLCTSLKVSSFAGRRVMLVGMTAEPFDVLTAIEGAGAGIVGDDLGLGWRTMSADVSETGDPVEALARHLAHLPQCSSLHRGGKSRGAYVVSRAKEIGANAVIFTRLKFCDPEAFDYPEIKCALDEAKIPNLLLERDLRDKAEGAVTTRVEAFLEQLG